MVRTAFTVLAWMCGASLAADPAPAAPDPAEPIPTDFDGVVSTEDLWSLIGSNGELRELWRGPPERIDTHGGEPPRVLKVSAFGEVREGESWRDLRTLAWVDDGSRPGRMRLRDANGVARLTAEARRGEDGAPIVLRFAFSAPKALRFRVSLPVGGPALSTEGAAVVIPDGPASRLTIVSRPPGSAASSGRAASIEVPPVAEIAIEVFPGKDRREPGGPPPPALPRIETGLPELDHLLEASVEAIEANSFRSGVVIAGSDGWYKNAWIRDGTYSVLGADLAGRRDLATRFFRFWLREGGFSWGGENEAQQPAIGILGMRTHALLLPPEEAAAFLREAYPYVKRYGDYYAGRVEKEGMIGTAEEWICQVPAPCSWPNAEVHAGLAAGSKIAEALAAAAPAIPTAGADAARWKAAAARLKEKIAEEAYDPKLGRFIPLAGPPGAVHKDEKNPGWSGPLRDERVDSGMLMLARSEVFGRGLGAVAVDDPRFISTQAAIGEVLSQSDRSISRFDGNLASPSYPGGEWPMWPISAAWAAQIEFLRGRTDAAWDHLLSGILKKTGVDHAEALLQLPEQWRYDGRPVRTTRLLTWSHGELLTATVFLLLGLDLDPEGADLGLSPSIPPGSRGASIKGWPFRGWELEIRIAPSEEGAKMQVKGKRGPKGPEILQIATPKGTVKLADGDEAVIQGRRPSASIPRRSAPRGSAARRSLSRPSAPAGRAPRARFPPKASGFPPSSPPRRCAGASRTAKAGRRRSSGAGDTASTTPSWRVSAMATTPPRPRSLPYETVSGPRGSPSRGASPRPRSRSSPPAGRTSAATPRRRHERRSARSSRPLPSSSMRS